MSAPRGYSAHATSRQDRTDWQPLAKHLRGVAELAGERVAKFKAAEWGHVARIAR